MSQHYSDKTRESDLHALPDVEIFHKPAGWFIHTLTAELCHADYLPENADMDKWENLGPGFYYWFCSPGCLPDSEPFGPYPTEEEALEAARES